MKPILLALCICILIPVLHSCASLRGQPESPHSHLTLLEQQNEALALMGSAERHKTAGNLDDAVFVYERVAREFPGLADETSGVLFESTANDRIRILKCLKGRGSDAFHASKPSLIVQIRDALKNKSDETLLKLVSCDFSFNKNSTEIDVLRKVDPQVAIPFIVSLTEDFIWEKETLVETDQLYFPSMDKNQHRFLFFKDPKGWLWTGFTTTSIERFKP
ncbi:MAG: hypothetical protein AABZ55_13250 [Bdellovibrionota bacterium]